MVSAGVIQAVRVFATLICLVNFVLLAGLRQRSFTYSEELFFRAPVANSFGIWTGVGRIVLTVHPRPEGKSGVHYAGPWHQSGRWRDTQQRADGAIPTLLGFGAGTTPNGQFRLMVPHWFAMLLIAGMTAGSAIAWLRSSFYRVGCSHQS